MKKFHHNYLNRSNEAEKKERKIKKHYPEEACKCFAPFVKLHWRDCPLVNKPCPIHGNHFNCIEKEANTEPVQDVTVSFYPSLKTERLFQPVKSLLAHCNPEAKINFQYYSQRNFTSKENTKDRFIQTNSEDFKRTLSNVFVEKTKSFITDKTNKMKKLKQCFYSPCNSITRRSLSQTSIREKTNEIPVEEHQHRNVLFNRTLEEPLDDITCDSSFEWFSPRKLDFENLVKLSDEKKDSDFITFTKRSKNSGINHKIFEIKHKKGLNDISAVKFPKQSTQFVYSTYNIDSSQHSKRNKKTAKKITSVETENAREKKKDEILSTSDKSQSSSSGSVYFTPFFLMPTSSEGWGNSNLVDRGTSAMIEPVQVEGWDGINSQDSYKRLIQKHCQHILESLTSGIPSVSERSTSAINAPITLVTISGFLKLDGAFAHSLTSDAGRSELVLLSVTKISSVILIAYALGDSEGKKSVLHVGKYDSAIEKCSAVSKGTQTTFQRSEQIESLLNEKPQLKSVSLQTEPLTEEKHSQITKEIFLRDYEPSAETLKDKFKDYDAVTIRDDVNDEIYSQKKCPDASRGKNSASNHLITSEVQTNHGHGHEEPFLTELCGGITRHQASQTEPGSSQEAFSKTFESEADNTQMTCTKGTQTSFSENTSSDFSNLTDFQSSNAIGKSLDQQEYELNSIKMTKIWYGKSCSDTELYERKKCKCAKADSMTPLPEVCLCKCSNLREMTNMKESAVQRSPFSRFLEDNPQTFESNNSPDIHKTSPETQKAVERLSKAEQTSLKDEYLPQAFSDLSELKKIIQKFFENTNSEENNQSEFDKERIINIKIDQGTMTDNAVMENKSVVSAKQNQKKLNNAETQTTVQILINDEIEKNHSREPKVKFRQSVLLSDKKESKTFFICALCGREMSRFCLNASTNTDSYEISPKIREKTTVIDTKYSKVIEVKTIKKAKDPCPPKESISNFKPIPKLTTSPEREKPPKTLKSTENSPRDINLQKSCIPILITEPGSAYVRKDRNLQEAEGQNTKPLVTTNLQIRQKPQIPRPPAAQQLTKQCLCHEIAGPSTIATSRITPISTIPNSSLIQKSKTQPKIDIFPSLPKVEHPGVQNSQWRKEDQSSHTNSKPSNKRTDGFYYPVSIKSVWPTEVRKACKPDNSACSTPKQKRGHEKESEPKDVPAGKKIKAFCDESKNECFLFGKPTFSDLLKGKHERDSGFIWVPSSSVPQVSSQNDFLSQYKTTKSEDFVRISHQQKASAQVKRYESDTSKELFTVESCHLKPVTLKYDQQPFNNLFECSICKSLTFLKTNKKHKSYIWPSSMFSYHRRTPENSIEKVLQETTPDDLSQCDEEFFRESLDFSGIMSLPPEESSENNIFEEEKDEVNNEFKELYPKSNLYTKPNSQSQIANISDSIIKDQTSQLDVSSSSESLNTFRFSEDPKKYRFKKFSK